METQKKVWVCSGCRRIKAGEGWIQLPREAFFYGFDNQDLVGRFKWIFCPKCLPCPECQTKLSFAALTEASCQFTCERCGGVNSIVAGSLVCRLKREEWEGILEEMRRNWAIRTSPDN